MVDVLSPARKRIINISDDFQRISGQLSQPVQFLHSENENWINEQIRDVLQEASKYLASSKDFISNQRRIDMPGNIVSEYLNEVERVKNELERKTRLFDTAICNAHKIFSTKLDSLNEMNRVKTVTQMEKLKKAEETLENNLREIRNSFDMRLNQEISIHITERNQLSDQLRKLQNENELMKSTLSTSLSASQMRQRLLEKQKIMLQETKVQVSDTIIGKYSQQILAIESQFSSQIENLENDYKRLVQKNDEHTKQYRNEIELLQKSLENIGASHQSECKRSQEKQSLKNSKKLKKLESQHNLVLSGINHQIELDEISSKNECQMLRSEIQQKKGFLIDGDVRYKESLDAIKKSMEMSLTEKENEMKLISKMHIRDLKQISQKHELEIEQEEHEAAKLRHSLDQKLNQTIREGDQTKRRLETEITALTRSKDKLEEEIYSITSSSGKTGKGTIKSQKTLSRSNSSTGIAISHPKVLISIPELRLSDNEEAEREIIKRIHRFSEVFHKEIESVESAMKSVDSRFFYEKSLHENISNLNKREIMLIEEEKKRTEEKISLYENLISSFSAKQTTDYHKNDDDFNTKIAFQQAIIMQMRDDLQKKKEDQSKRDDISYFHSFLNTELSKYKETLDSQISINQQNLALMRESNENNLYNDRKKNQEVLDFLQNSLVEISKETQVTVETSMNEINSNHNLWMSIRKEMADSNNKLFGVLNSTIKSRPLSSASRGSQRRSISSK